MIEPKIDDLLARVDSKYTLVILAARRARQIRPRTSCRAPMLAASMFGGCPFEERTPYY